LTFTAIRTNTRCFPGAGSVIPKTWPDDRFDMIWAFTLSAHDQYSFGQIPQLLLSGETDTIIAPG
jgi:hypothetical protein